ncbi:MAG: WD40 repeat domain-containing protein [Anaerolineae bacterium]|nr:WD40 repeat domain-containing protein [Anaerolineae bacterium]
MDEAELRRSMEAQAACAGLRFESDLSQQMLDDVSGEPGAMPLLQHALWTLWTRRHGRWLHAEEYRAFGGVKQAIASTAEAVFARCSDFEKERLRDIFLRLTRLDDSADGRDTRRRVLLRDLIPADSDPAATALLIKQLADARLVVVNGDEVEVAHEALIRHWERLRAWLNDDRDNLRLREGVSDDARRWENGQRDESLLNHRGARLELALAMSKNPRYRLNLVEQAYLDGCVALMKREKAAAARRRKYTIAGVSAALLVIMVILAGWGWSSNENSKQLSYQVATSDAAKIESEYQKATAIAETNLRATAQASAEEQRDIALARQLAAQSSSLTEQQLDLALLLSIEGLKIRNTAETRDALLSSILYSPQLDRFLMKNDLPITNLTISDSNKKALIVINRGTIILWDIENAKILSHISIDTGKIGCITFLPFSDEAFISCQENFVTFWTITVNNEFLSTSEFVLDETPSSIDFSPNGNLLAISSYNKSIEIWEIEDIYHPRSLVLLNKTEHSSAYWIYDPNFLISVDSKDKKLNVWDIRNISSPTLAKTIDIGSDYYEYSSLVTAISADKKLLAIASNFGGVRIWDISIPTQPIKSEQIFSVEKSISKIAFNHSSTNLAVADSLSNSIFLWDITNFNTPTKKFSTSLNGHTKSITGLFFDKNSKKLYSTSFDGHLVSWNTEENQALVLSNTSIGIIEKNGIQFSPNGQVLAITTKDFWIGLWNILDNYTLEPAYQSISGNAASFGPDGMLLAASTGDAINIFNVTNPYVPVLMSSISSENAKVFSLVAFSPTKRVLAATDSDHNVILWDISNHPQPIRVSSFATEHKENIFNISFSLDGNTLATIGQENAVKLWDISDIHVPKFISVLTGHDAFVESAVFSPTNTLLATGGFDGQILLWDINNIFNPSLIRSPILSSFNVPNLVFTPDGEILVAESYSGVFLLWDVSNPKQIIQLGPNISGINSSGAGVKISPNGHVLAFVGEKRNVVLWDLRVESWLTKACHMAGRNLTNAEWDQYIPDKPYRITCPSLLIDP